MILAPTVEAASNQDMEGVREVIAGLMGSWNVHDMHAFADLFTEDASFVNVNGSWMKTRAQIEESHKVVHASIFKNSRAIITPSKMADHWRFTECASARLCDDADSPQAARSLEHSCGPKRISRGSLEPRFR
jgi:hypothetical protein